MTGPSSAGDARRGDPRTVACQARARLAAGVDAGPHRIAVIIGDLATDTVATHELHSVRRQSARRHGPCRPRSGHRPGTPAPAAPRSARVASDPSVVVVGGPASMAGDALVERLRPHLAARWPVSPTVELSHLGEDAVARGALGSALAAAERRLFAPV